MSTRSAELREEILRGERVLCVQPHYDDNDIAAGGTFALLADAGIGVQEFPEHRSVPIELLDQATVAAEDEGRVAPWIRCTEERPVRLQVGRVPGDGRVGPGMDYASLIVDQEEFRVLKLMEEGVTRERARIVLEDAEGLLSRGG